MQQEDTILDTVRYQIEFLLYNRTMRLKKVKTAACISISLVMAAKLC